MNRIIKAILISITSILIYSSVYTAAGAAIVFSISNPIVGADDEIEVDATISGLISSSCSTGGCFLQAELQSAGGYFGYTFNNSGEYVDFFKSPASTDEIKSKLFNFVPVSGAWTGKLKAKNNPASLFYYGPGDYLLNFRRFSGNSLSPTSGDSSIISVSLKAPLPTSKPTDTPQANPTPTPTATPLNLKTAPPTAYPTPILIKSPSPTPIRLPASTPINISEDASLTGRISGVLGIENEPIPPDPPNPTEMQNSGNKFPLSAVGLIVLGVGLIGFSIFSIIKSVKKSYNIESEIKNN